MNYVTYDAAGNLTGCYEQELHADHASHYIVVTPSQGANWTAYRANASRSRLEPAQPVAIEVETPLSVPMLNARLTLIGAGKMAVVRAYLDAIPGVVGEQAREYFASALTMKRNHPLVLGIPPEIMTEPEKDALFTVAGALNA